MVEHPHRHHDVVRRVLQGQVLDVGLPRRDAALGRQLDETAGLVDGEQLGVRVLGAEAGREHPGAAADLENVTRTLGPDGVGRHGRRVASVR